MKKRIIIVCVMLFIVALCAACAKTTQVQIEKSLPAETAEPEPTPAPTAAPTAEPEPEPSEEPQPEADPTPTPAVIREYVLNKGTMKFHKPSCSSVKDIKEENKEFFEGTRDEVIEMGYEPCGRCHP